MMDMTIKRKTYPYPVFSKTGVGKSGEWFVVVPADQSPGLGEIVEVHKSNGEIWRCALTEHVPFKNREVEAVSTRWRFERVGRGGHEGVTLHYAQPKR